MATIDDVYALLQVLAAEAGGLTVDMRVVDSDGAPLAGVGIVIESIYGNLVGVAVSDAGGFATVKLDAGTYNVFLRKTGTALVFANPYVLVVSAAGSTEFAASTPGLASPTDPSMARIYGWVRDLGMSIQEGVTLVFALKQANVVTDGGIVIADAISVETDVDGFFEVSLPISKNLVPSNVAYVVTLEEARGNAGFRLIFNADQLEAGGDYRLNDLTR